VLYPWKGKKYLCHGGIMPYYEFKWPANNRLTDAEFKKLLDQKPSKVKLWLESLP
jgi:hypothetical protein